jgi:hypothetical protein
MWWNELEGSIVAGMTTARHGSCCVNEIDLGTWDNRAGRICDHTINGRRRRWRSRSRIRSKNCNRRKQDTELSGESFKSPRQKWKTVHPSERVLNVYNPTHFVPALH